MDLQIRLHEIGSIKHRPDMKYLINMLQHAQYFASKYLKRSFQKSRMESSSTNMGLVCIIYKTQSNRIALLVDLGEIHFARL